VPTSVVLATGRGLSYQPHINHRSQGPHSHTDQKF